MTTPVPAPSSFPELTPRALDFTSGPALHIASAVAEIPPATPVEDAIRAGRYSQDDADVSGFVSVAIAKESSTLLDLASAAAMTATTRAAVPAADIGILLFVSLFPYTRPPIFSTVASLAETIGAPSPFTAEIAGGCTAGLDALSLAANRLLLSGERAALVVAGDLWTLPHIDRFSSEPGLIFADGATAVVLTRDAGYARLLSAATLTDPSLSSLHAHVPSDRTPIDLTARALAFLETRMGPTEAFARIKSGMTSTVHAALAQAGITLADVAHLVVPAVGKTFLHRNYLDPLGLPVSCSTWDYSATTGHIGAADPFGALAYLVDHDRCRRGDYILMVADGIGFQWSAMVVQVE